jgi:TonB family protein
MIPDEARSGVKGKVRIAVGIRTDGEIAWASVESSSGNGDQDS